MTIDERFNWVETTEGNKMYKEWIEKLCQRVEQKLFTFIHMMDNGDFYVYVIPSNRMKKYITERQPGVNFSDPKTRVKIFFSVRTVILTQLKIIVKRYENHIYDDIDLITLYESIEEAIEKDIAKKVLHAEDYFFAKHPD